MKIEIEENINTGDSDKQILRKNLLKMSLPDLSRVLGDEIIKNLEENGFDTEKNTLADQIISQIGFKSFEHEVIRSNFCFFFKIDPINSWKNNKQCKEFLKAIGLSEDFLPKPRNKRKLSEEVSPDFILHDYQDHIKRKTSEFLLTDEKQKLMIQLPTGAGKTALAMNSIYDYLRISQEKNPLIIWMAHTDELCEQAVESFIQGWKGAGTKNINILRLWGGNLSGLDKIPEGPVFAVASFQTAYSMLKARKDSTLDNFIKLKNRCNLLVVDEAHMSLAETYKTAIELFSGSSCKVIGLTATPGRHGIEEKKDETLELVSFYENNILNLNEFCEEETPIKYLQNREILSSVKPLILETQYDIELSDNDKKSLEETGILSENHLKKSGNDSRRTSLIIDQIVKLVAEDRKILVFAPSKQSSDTYSALLKSKNVAAESVTGETSFTDRQNSVLNFGKNKISVLINYNVFTTGFDDPEIDCIVIARPTFSVVLYSQMIGRGLRGPANGGTKECVLVDVKDNLINQPDIEIACNYFTDEWK